MLPERIMSKVAVADGGCWLWSGSMQRNGYGYTTWRIDGKWKHARVHRLFYEDYVGPIPDGLEIDHTCRVRNCVNPDHLRAVTHADNLKTRVRVYTRSSTCGRGHEFTPENTYTHRTKGTDRIGRSCKTCARLTYDRRRTASA
jgi:hypothetical protein